MDTINWYISFRDVFSVKMPFLNTISALSLLLSSFEFKLRSRTAPQHFSREGGKLGLVNTILNTLNFNNKSQELELDDYFEP